MFVSDGLQDFANILNSIRSGISDFNRFIAMLSGKDYIANKSFVLKVTEQGSFYLNGLNIGWISTDTNQGRLLRTLVNDRYYASDTALKIALKTDDINLVYKEVSRLKEVFKKNGYNLKVIRLKAGYEITNITNLSF